MFKEDFVDGLVLNVERGCGVLFFLFVALVFCLPILSGLFVSFCVYFVVFFSDALRIDC